MIFRELLGNILVNLGYVSRGQIEEALQRQREETGRLLGKEFLCRQDLISRQREGFDSEKTTSLGDILLQMGLVTSEQLNLALKIQKESLTFSDDLEARKLARIIQLGSIVNSTLNISEVLHNVMELANGVTNAVASTLMLLDQETGELVFSVPTGPKSNELMDVRIPPGKGIAGWVARHRQPLLIPDASRDQRFFPNIDHMSGFKTESILCVPLQIKGRLIGVLEAINKADQEQFDKEDELMLGIFATQAAMAIENAQLYSELSFHLDELKNKQRSLEESEFKYRTVSELTSDFSFSLKNDGSGGFFMEWITDAFKAVTGYDPRQFKSTPDCLDIFHPDDRTKIQKHFFNARGGASGKGEFRAMTAAGETIWLNISYNPLFCDNIPEVERIVGVAREITARVKARDEKKTLERMLRQSQKMEALGTLTGGIAHDFNNILQAISGSAQLIAREKTGKIGKYVGQIESSVQRAADLIARLMTFSRDMKPRQVSMDLNQEVSQVSAILHQTFPRMIQVEKRLAENLPPIKGDPNQLHHLLLNLAANARDAMPQGGVLCLGTEKVFLDRGGLNLAPGEYVRLVVSDNGLGMDRATRQKAFEPFFTTKEVGKGTGLGLSSVYGIVQGHGGRIDCLSEPGQGTSFVIDLPVSNNPPENREITCGKETELILGGEMEKILVVDDEPLVLDISKEILEQSGFQVVTASTGEQALEIYKNAKDKIDLVLLDLSMPGMGGRKTLEQLLKLDRGAKVLVASGLSPADREEEVAGPGAKGYINKPYRINDLLGKVREALDN